MPRWATSFGVVALLATGCGSDPVGPQTEDSSGVSVEREQLPVAVDSFERVDPPALEPELGSHHKVAYGTRNEDLGRTGFGHDAGGDVDPDSPDVVASRFDLSGVQSGSDREADSFKIAAEA